MWSVVLCMEKKGGPWKMGQLVCVWKREVGTSQEKDSVYFYDGVKMLVNDSVNDLKCGCQLLNYYWSQTAAYISKCIFKMRLFHDFSLNV